MQPMTIFYVKSPINSVQFYAKLLDITILEQQNTFSLCLFNGCKLAFWAKDQVEPPANFTGNNSELALRLNINEDVDELFRQIQSHFTVLQ